jgi:hypothetical protein
MLDCLSRRALLVAMASAGLPSSQVSQIYPGIPLSDLWIEMRALITTWQKLGPNFPDDLIVRFHDIKDRMLGFPVHELESLVSASEILAGEGGYGDDGLE